MALTLQGMNPYVYSALTNPAFSYAPQVHNLLGPQIYQQLMNGTTQQQPMPQAAPSTNMQAIQPQLNRLTGQANNALYGGLLGYNQNMPMMSGGSNPQTFSAPQGDFRSAFAGMQGLLGGR